MWRNILLGGAAVERMCEGRREAEINRFAPRLRTGERGHGVNTSGQAGLRSDRVLMTELLV